MYRQWFKLIQKFLLCELLELLIIRIYIVFFLFSLATFSKLFMNNTRFSEIIVSCNESIYKLKCVNYLYLYETKMAYVAVIIFLEINKVKDPSDRTTNELIIIDFIYIR